MALIKNNTLLTILVWILLGCSLLLFSWFDHHTGSMWGWVNTDFADGHTPTLIDAVAVFQLVLLAVTTDVLMRWSVNRFNTRSIKSQIPAILVQCFSILIYAVFSLVSFITLFDHSGNYILAASGAIGLSVGYVCKDVIADFVNSVLRFRPTGW